MTSSLFANSLCRKDSLSDSEKRTVLPSLAASLASVVLPCLCRTLLGKLAEDVSPESWILGSAARMKSPLAHPTTPNPERQTYSEAS